MADNLRIRANSWIDLDCGARVHRTAVVNFEPMSGRAFARPVSSFLEIVRLSKGVVIGPYAIVYAGSFIGADTQICPYAHIREGVSIGERCVIGVGVRIGYNARIGNDCQIMDDTHISGGTEIGDRCFVSVQVLAVNDDRPRGYKWKGITPVVVGSDVVIGAGARLRPGVKVGNGATIGMGAVVTKDVATGAKALGFPARQVCEDWHSIYADANEDEDQIKFAWQEPVL